MRNVEKRQKDVLRLVEKLDITPTMFEAAKERYTNLGKYLQSKNPDFDIYPQGSFAIGTVIRPLKKNHSFDLDFIINSGKYCNDTTPKETKLQIKGYLDENQVYKDKMDKTEYDKCWTLVYEDEFSMDIVPSVYFNKEKGTEIAITNKIGLNYSWYKSNPKAYRDWFDKINQPFKFHSWLDNRSKIFSEYRGTLYSSIEEIPEELNRSALQRVIQIIKRHRDIYYDKCKKSKKKPSSVIITTLSAQIADLERNKSIGVFSLLSNIANALKINTKKKVVGAQYFLATYGNKYNQIEYKNNQWYLPNPINPNDNLVDAWNNDAEIVSIFNDWIKQLKEDFVDGFSKSDEQFVATLTNSFGSDFVNNNLNKSKYEIHPPKQIIATPKPWGA